MLNQFQFSETESSKAVQKASTGKLGIVEKEKFPGHRLITAFADVFSQVIIIIKKYYYYYYYYFSLLLLLLLLKLLLLLLFSLLERETCRVGIA